MHWLAEQKSDFDPQKASILNYLCLFIIIILGISTYYNNNQLHLFRKLFEVMTCHHYKNNSFIWWVIKFLDIFILEYVSRNIIPNGLFH